MSHMAGIIPVANMPHDYSLPYSPLLLPVNKDHTLLQRAVYECALAGCNTIWIVVNDDVAPILRGHIGEWIHDPVYYNRTYTKFPSENRKEIPIYYVPINPKHRDRFDSYGWSILYGCYMSWYASFKISKWIRPDNFYVSFPMSVVDLQDLRDKRSLISNVQNNFMMRCDKRTITDGVPLSFTMTGDDYKKCRDHIKELTTREYLPPLEGEQYPSEKLPIEERWSARYFSLETVFSPLKDNAQEYYDSDYFYDNTKWENYMDMIKNKKVVFSPEKDLLKSRFHARIPYVD